MSRLPVSLVLLSIGLVSPAAAADKPSVRQIADTYAKQAISSGQAIGIGVAVVLRGQKPQFFTYGDAVVESGGNPAVPFTPNSLFQIGSVTKVFTTNLLGQAVTKGQLGLNTPLSDFHKQLGTLKPSMGAVTLKQLADFTGGIADYAPLCTQSKVPGCLPSGRPTLKQYDGQDFATYFANTVPQNFSANPPKPARKLPAPYYYSDFGVGLLGLLLAERDKPLSNADVAGWNTKIKRQILNPLNMRRTYLNVPKARSGLIAAGYNQATARASVDNGAIADIDLITPGGLYTSAPKVRITGGGGTGAKAVAELDGERVGKINVTAGGSGYVAPATVTFTNGNSTETANAHVIVSKGKVIGVSVDRSGAGYQNAPDVKISGGLAGPNTRNATATAHIADGRVTYISVDDPGKGYVAPLAVVVAPGGSAENAIPIWAPAGSLSSSLSDMAKFAAAAMPSSPGRGGDISRGFRIAERPYACASGNPKLSKCPTGAAQSGLAWSILPKDADNGVPKVVTKDGSLGGYTTFVALMPDKQLGVVVFANSRGTVLATGAPTLVAPQIAKNIFYALYYEKVQGSGHR